MPFGFDLPKIPTIPDLPDVDSYIKDKTGCSLSEINEIQKYLNLIPTQIIELNRRLNLPSDCTLVNIPELMKFTKENPDFSIPTQESIQAEVKRITNCSETKIYLKKNSDQLATLLTIITESKKCKEKSAIEYQTQSIKNKIPDLESKKNTYTEKTKYQTEMYASVKYVNDILLIFYALLFSVIHVLIFVQYVQGVKRDEIADTVWLTVFFLYPYLIYYVEKTIYSSVMYILSLIYGTTYVYQFDKLLLFTDFYYNPDTDTSLTQPDGILGISNAVMTTSPSNATATATAITLPK
jgi:hypothetical protein